MQTQTSVARAALEVRLFMKVKKKVVFLFGGIFHLGLKVFSYHRLNTLNHQFE